MKKLLTISLAFAGIHSGVLSANAAFTRLATETYPGGGGVATNAVAGITTNGVPVALDANKIAHLVIPEGGGPTGGVTKAYVDAQDLSTLNSSKEYTDLEETRATTAEDGLTSALAAETLSRIAGDETNAAAIVAASIAATNYTDSVTNALLPLILVRVTTNDFVNATNDIWLAIDTNAAAIVAASIAGTNYTDTATNAATSFVKANYLPLAGGTMTGDITMGNNSLIFDSLRKISAGPDDSMNFDANYYGFGGQGPVDRSFLTADGTPVVTSNMLNGVLAPATNALDTALRDTLVATNNLLSAAIANEAYDRSVADGKLLTKQSPSYPTTRNLKWSGYNLELMGPMLFETWGSIKVGSASSNTSLPDYLKNGLWNTSDDPFVRKSFVTNEVVTATNDLEAVLVEYVDDGDTATYTSAQLYTKAYAYPFTQGNIISNTVSQWEGYWNGSNVYWSVTNYLEAGNAKVMKLYEIQTNGVHREVWNDSDKYDIFFTNTLAAVSLTNDYTVGVVSNLLDSKADRAWGKYCSTGEDAPNTNTTWISSQETVMAGGYAYRKVSVGSGTISVLVSHGSVPYATGKEASFTIGDGYGTNYFGYVAQDNFVLGADCEGITVAGGLVTMDYQVIGSTFPIMYWCDDLITKDWQQMNRSDGTAIPTAPFGGATWSLAAGGTAAKVHVNVGTAPQGFFSCMTTNIGGGTFKTNMRADFLDAGLMCTNTLSTQMGVIRPKFNGTTVEWVWSVE